MNADSPELTSEVIALVHHVELNRAGWWDRAVNRLVVAAVWLRGKPSRPEDVQSIFKDQFRLPLSTNKLSLVMVGMEKQGVLSRKANGTYEIVDGHRVTLEKDIAEAERVSSDAKAFFLHLVGKICPDVEAEAAWLKFDSYFLTPLIAEVGVNAYRLLAGEKLVVDSALFERFLGKFERGNRTLLTNLVTEFLNPNRPEVRAYISRMLHARFCVEASGLPAKVIDKLNAIFGKQIRFRMFVDTNFLFSLLQLHENPSNAAAKELLDLVSALNSNPKVDLYITPRTIEEAKSSIAAAKSQLANIPSGQNFTQAALRVGFSGMAERFLMERLQRGGANLTVDDWFDPYLNDFVPIARAKGVELFNESLDSYSMRQDVVDDINLVLKFEQRLDPSRRKSYEKVAHDMILWHCVNDKRPAYIESPIDAQDWILTVDFRFIGFDQHKNRKTGRNVPICLHPTSFIQLLQFWVPRTKEFEEAILGSLRLPFLFQEFDAEAEKTSIKILKGLGRFEIGTQIPEETLTQVILNDELRARLKTDHTEEEEIQLVRDALVEELKNKLDSESTRVDQLVMESKQREAKLSASQLEARTKDETLDSLRQTIAEEKAKSGTLTETITNQGREIELLKANWQIAEAEAKRRRTQTQYISILGGLLVVSAIVSWQSSKFLPLVAIIGLSSTRIAVGVLIFILCHVLLEIWASRNKTMAELRTFKQVMRFRKWLWSLVILAIIVGVIGNLVSNRIQKRLDHKEQSNPVVTSKPESSK